MQPPLLGCHPIKTITIKGHQDEMGETETTDETSRTTPAHHEDDSVDQWSTSFVEVSAEAAVIPAGSLTEEDFCVVIDSPLSGQQWREEEGSRDEGEMDTTGSSHQSPFSMPTIDLFFSESNHTLGTDSFANASLHDSICNGSRSQARPLNDSSNRHLRGRPALNSKAGSELVRTASFIQRRDRRLELIKQRVLQGKANVTKNPSETKEQCLHDQPKTPLELHRHNQKHNLQQQQQIQQHFNRRRQETIPEESPDVVTPPSSISEGRHTSPRRHRGHGHKAVAAPSTPSPLRSWRSVDGASTPQSSDGHDRTGRTQRRALLLLDSPLSTNSDRRATLRSKLTRKGQRKDRRPHHERIKGDEWGMTLGSATASNGQSGTAVSGCGDIVKAGLDGESKRGEADKRPRSSDDGNDDDCITSSGGRCSSVDGAELCTSPGPAIGGRTMSARYLMVNAPKTPKTPTSRASNTSTMYRLQHQQKDHHRERLADELDGAHQIISQQQGRIRELEQINLEWKTKFDQAWKEHQAQLQGSSEALYACQQQHERTQQRLQEALSKIQDLEMGKDLGCPKTKGESIDRCVGGPVYFYVDSTSPSRGSGIRHTTVESQSEDVRQSSTFSSSHKTTEECQPTMESEEDTMHDDVEGVELIEGRVGEIDEVGDRQDINFRESLYGPRVQGGDVSNFHFSSSADRPFRRHSGSNIPVAHNGTATAASLTKKKNTVVSSYAHREQSSPSGGRRSHRHIRSLAPILPSRQDQSQANFLEAALHRNRKPRRFSWGVSDTTHH